MKVDFEDITKETYKLEDEYIKTLTQAYQDSLNDIDEQIRRMYSKYNVKGKFSLDAFQKMTKTEQGQITRLELLEKQVFSDLTRLAQGRPQQLAGYLTDVYGMNYEGVLNTLMNESGVTGSFDMLNRKAIYQSARTPLTDIAIKDTTDTLKMAIRRDLTNGIVQGDGIGGMMNRIRQSMDVSVNRAERIVRTETTRIMGQSRDEAFIKAEKMGIKFKKVWISTNDKRTRKSHEKLQGESVDRDKPFSNGLMYPGEPGANPSETVMCRCTMIAEVVDEEVKAGTAQAEITNRAEAEQALIDKCGFTKVRGDLSSIDEELLISNTNQLIQLEDRFGIVKQSKNSTFNIENMSGRTHAAIGSKVSDPLSQRMIVDRRTYGNKKNHIQGIIEDQKTGYHMASALEKRDVYTITHEYGHMIHNKLLDDAYEIYGKEKLKAGVNLSAKSQKTALKPYYKLQDKTLKEINNEIISIAKAKNKDFDINVNISKYGKTNSEEFFAEAFANSQLGEPNELGVAMQEFLKLRGW